MAELRPILLVVDDEPTVHALWDARLGDTLGSQDRLKHFSSLRELQKWRNLDTLRREILYLSDLEFFGEEDDGLTGMGKLGLLQQTILVTGRAQEAALRGRCEKLGVRLLSKESVPWVPIELSNVLTL